MAKLYLRGVQKPFTIEKQTAQTINKIVEDKSIPSDRQFNRNGLRFSKGDVRYIVENDIDDDQEKASDEKKNENDTFYSDVLKEHNKNVLRLCDRDIETKSKDTRIYEIIWSGHTLNPITQEYLDEVVRRQYVFYEKYPTAPYAAINVSDILPHERSSEYSIKEMMPSYIPSKVYQIIGEAYTTAKFLGKMK